MKSAGRWSKLFKVTNLKLAVKKKVKIGTTAGEMANVINVAVYDRNVEATGEIGMTAGEFRTAKGHGVGCDEDIMDHRFNSYVECCRACKAMCGARQALPL